MSSARTRNAQKRWALYVVLTAALLYAFYFLRVPSQPETFAQPASGSTAGQVIPGPVKFNWSKRKQQYPVKNFRRLPLGEPKRLRRVQYEFGEEDPVAASLREARRGGVKRAFERAWSSYKEKAWMQDELAPISGGAKATFGGWAATLIDTLDTLWIMDMKSDFEEAVNAVVNVDFHYCALETVNVFETTIRHLGGLLGAYDLSGDKRLLKKAVEVGDMLYVAFDTPNHMPITRWKPAYAVGGTPQVADKHVLVAEIGSLTMEFTRLTQLTGDPKYYDAVARVMDAFEDQQYRTKLPGMWPVLVDAEVPDFTGDTFFTLGGMSDSLYEYFPKTHALLGGLEPVYQRFYEGSMKTAIEHLVFKPMLPNDPDILAVGSVRVSPTGHVTLNPEWQHLVCFAGGMLAVGGRLFDDDEHVDIGQKLTDACIWTYKTFPTGIMPEISHLVPCPARQLSADGKSCAWNETYWKGAVQERMVLQTQENIDQHIRQDRLQPGFTKVDDRRYILRPEAIESVFVLYRITGKQALQAAAWDMFTSIQRHTMTDLANAALGDVTVMEGAAPKEDSMESFWLAETLKYFYLIFSEPELVSLDDFVFNTEAHPFRIPKPEKKS